MRTAAAGARWLEEVLSWHRDLCRRAEALDPDWWLTDGSRITLWYPAELVSLFQTLAERGRMEEEPGEIPLEAGLLADLREAARLARRLPLRRAIIPSAKTVVFSYSLDAKVLAKQDDHYFGGMLDEIPDQDALWSYYLDHADERQAVLAHLSRKGRRGLIYTDALSFADLPGLLAKAARLRRTLAELAHEAPPLEVEGRTDRLFPKRFLARCLGRLPLIELGARLAFERLVAESEAQAVLYPYEEKGIERAILSAARGRARTLAFAHAVYNDGHLYARSGVAPRPDVLLVTGPAARDWWVREAVWPAERVREVGSPRFPGGAMPPSARDGALKVLFFAGYEYEMPTLARWVERRPDLFSGCELRVRPYPYKWAESQDRGLKRLHSLVPSLRADLEPLDEQVRWCDVAVFDSTSAGFHAMLRGRPAVSVALQGLVDTDPLKGKGLDGSVPRCSSAAELKASLDRLRGMSTEEYALEARRQREAAARVYAAPGKEALAEILLMRNKI